MVSENLRTIMSIDEEVGTRIKIFLSKIMNVAASCEHCW